MTWRELPMFPLGTVLFPGGVLPLHVFEPRYRAMTGHCLKHDRRMGIVLIERGSEVGGGDVRMSVGTEAVITEAANLPDGRWVLLLLGTRRIRIERWFREQPFPRAEVSPLDDGERSGGDAAVARDGLVRRVHRALALKAELGEWPEAEVAPDLAVDPAVATWQAAGLGLVGPADGQRLLETVGVDDRLGLLASLLDEQIDVLALRAAGR
ncbi:MAG: LON peptidase substrate-binding domain-containing protein [Actinobacteria bacterium]|nr:LON peptidase substrate-binding domain-containing protein [Actinomycetota bacterium]